MSPAPSNALDYDRLVSDYRKGLVDRLRGFGVAEAFLELWVPDDDLHRSLANLVQAAREANRNALLVHLGPITAKDLDAVRLREGLHQSAQLRLGKVAEGGVLLEFTGLVGQEATLVSALADHVGPQAASRAKEIAGIVAAAGSFHADQPLEPATISSAYIVALAGATEDGPTPAQKTGKNLAMAEGRLGAVTLRVTADPLTQIIASATFSGATNEVSRGLLAALSGLSLGLTVHQLADHGAISLEAALRAPNSKAGPAGIRLARAADPAFRWIEALTRATLADWRLRTGYRSTTNEYDFPPRPQWLAAEEAQRHAWLGRAIVDTGLREGISVLGIEVSRIEYDVRVILTLPEKMARGAREHVLLTLERGIKARVDPRLEVFSEELKDKNVIRRMK